MIQIFGILKVSSISFSNVKDYVYGMVLEILLCSRVNKFSGFKQGYHGLRFRCIMARVFAYTRKNNESIRAHILNVLGKNHENPRNRPSGR